jgi:hypothetical protein
MTDLPDALPDRSAMMSNVAYDGAVEDGENFVGKVMFLCYLKDADEFQRLQEWIEAYFEPRTH